MAISVVQHTNTITSNTTPATLTFAGATTPGNAIIIITANDDGPNASSPTPTHNSDTFIHEWSRADGGGGNGIDVFASYNIAGTSATVSVTTNTFDNFSLTAYEVSGLATTSCFDAASPQIAYVIANPVVSANITTQFANELLIGIGFDNNATTPSSWTVGAGWSNLEFTAPNSFTGLATQTKIVSSTGTYSSTMTDGLAGPFATSWIISFADTAVTSRPTKLYLLNTTTITHPVSIDNATLSVALPGAASNKRTAVSTALDLGTSFASAQTTANWATGTVAALTAGHLKNWVSNNLGGSNIAAGTWTMGMVWDEANLAANQFMNLSVYVLTSGGTVRGFIWDSTTAIGTEFAATETGVVATFSGAGVTGVLNTDKLVVEVWASGTQTGTTTRTVTGYWNGRGDPLDAKATGNAASYIQAPVDIFAAGGASFITATPRRFTQAINRASTY